MYTSFFGLNEKPFSITPNPRYLYMSQRHTEALAHLIYGIKDSGGFIQLTGEVGTGKTTLIRSLLQRLPQNADVALILNPRLSAIEFLESILEELSIPKPDDKSSVKALTDALNNFLLENYSKGRRTILILDEAQNFAVDVLEQIRLLTNLETAQHKLLQITLIGQPELRSMLARTDLRQLAQRITGRYHLEPLSQADTEEYVQHRLRVAGATRPIFTSAACRELYRLSGGVPRIINVIADRSLLGAFSEEEQLINPALVRRAAREVYGQHPDKENRTRLWLRLFAVAGIGALLVGGAVFLAGQFSTPVRPTAPDPLSKPVSVDLLSDDTATTVSTEPFEEVLRDNPAQTDTRTAFNNLFALWGVSFDDKIERACDQAQQYQLACLFERGSLAQIQRLDRPAILTLQDYTGATHQVVLSGLTNDIAFLVIGNESVTVTTNELSELWFGEFLLLWRPQTSTVKSFAPGTRAPEIVWLRQSLAAIQGSPIEPMTSDLFDKALEDRVRDYQVARRLNVDGMVGQQTQIVLNSDLDIGAPRLTRSN